MPVEVSRRNFLKGAAVGLGLGLGLSNQVGAIASPVIGGRGAATVAPSDKIRLGFIGLAGRGYGNHLDWFGRHPDVEIAALCDVYPAHLDRAVKKVGGNVKAFHDFRQLLDQPDVDAVVIATPPHWHALISIAACDAGKDVYCEKPMSRYPAEARAMVRAAAVNRRVTQVGTQIHATENYHKCVDVVRSGALGPITAIRNFCTMDDNSEGLGNPPDSAPLPGLDWDFWLGPAPKVPFNIGRFRDGMHRYFTDYVNSWLHELGPHIVDLPVWAAQLGQPLAVSASGGRFATTSEATVPDTLDVLWEYPNMTMTWTLMQQNAFNFGVGAPGVGRQLGIAFCGKKATLLANYDICQVLDPNGKPVEGATYPAVIPPSPGHEREFLNSIKSREETSCSFANDLPLHVALNLAHVSLRMGRKIHWDADKFEVINDREANADISPHYRGPWKLPR
ncbi:MAG TPA: Gfo/Idh/MocA family oxidoreductase [Armatimonadota bacterium]|nr:Gfo/Idh/MocA family oxidoreductase [Armatimonadota bacterium]